MAEVRPRRSLARGVQLLEVTLDCVRQIEAPRRGMTEAFEAVEMMRRLAIDASDLEAATWIAGRLGEYVESAQCGISLEEVFSLTVERGN